MPIYAYKCESCGFSKDVLQKISDAALQDCPDCGKATFKKQLTAAGFQLKGSGWYVTDFKGSGAAPAAKAASGAEAPASGTSTAPADAAPAPAAGTSDAKVATPSTDAPAKSTAAPTPKPSTPSA